MLYVRPRRFKAGGVFSVNGRRMVFHAPENNTVI